MMRLLLCAALIGVPCQAYAQDKAKPDKDKGFQALPDELLDKAKTQQDFNKLLEVVSTFGSTILFFGGGAILLIACLGWNGLLKEQSVVRMIALIFLATLAAFLIVGGYSPGQIGSATTLLGTLAGYIFGRRDDTTAPTPPPTTPATPG
jgi:hypothetical protein